MKSKKIVTIITSLLLVSLISIASIWIQRDINSSAAAVEGTKVKYTKDKKLPLGSEGNPFLILEIVPFEGFASIGYQIAGQEPVNMKLLSWSELFTQIYSIGAFSEVKREEIITFSPTDDMLNANDYMKRVEQQVGYYQRVNDNTGGYDQTHVYRDSNGKVTGADFVKVADNTGDFDLKWLEYASYIPRDDQNENKVYVTRTATLYTGRHYSYKHNNTFKKVCLKIPDDKIDSYQCKVVTVTATQLNNNLELINDANLIYLVDKYSSGYNCIDIWKDQRFRRNDMFQYNEASTVTNYDQTRFFNSGRDLCWEAVIKILQKKDNRNLPSDVKPCPVIYDCNSLTSSIPMKSVSITTKYLGSTKTKTDTIDGSENNAYKLGLLMRYMDTAKLYDLGYLNEIESVNKTTENITTGKFKNLDGNSTYWNAGILIPYYLVSYNNNSDIMKNDLIKLGYSTQDGYDYIYNTMSKEGMYMYNANTSMGMNFNSPSVVNTVNTKEAFEYFKLGSSDKISAAQVIQYLLDRPFEEEINISNLSILEIQPFAVYKTEQQWIDFLAKSFPGFTGDELTIEQMTSKEFNCRIEELVGTYDLVYIGLNKPANIQSIDLADDDYVYSHVGKIVDINNNSAPNMVNWYPGKSGNFSTRFSGNDITLLKKEKLIKYVELGYPIIFASGMFDNNDYNDISPKIDRNSNVYNLVKEKNNINSYASNMMYEYKILTDTTLRETFKQVIKKMEYNVSFNKLPEAYDDTDDKSYINASSSANRNLGFKFKIEDDGTTPYYGVSLCIDANADGVFKVTSKGALDNEKLDEIEVKEINNNNVGDTVASNRLVAGQEYVIAKELDDYSGVITWQISIERLKQDVGGAYVPSGIKYNKTGISAIKNTKPIRETIKVLQIACDNGDGGKGTPSIYLPTEAEITSSGAINITDSKDVARSFKNIIKDENGNEIPEYLSNVSGLFYYYIRGLKDYDIRFERLSVTQYINKVKANKIDLSDYQMLIIGFADLFTDIDSSDSEAAESARTKIMDFINKGKTVLFTHDTTHHQSTNKMTQTFRERLGMDRFGTMMFFNRNNPSATDLKAAGKDIAYNNEIKQSYGFTNQQLQKYALSDYKASFESLLTTEVSNINKGQITEYPYKINDNITIAKTHYQYFQLDLEDPEIVVWYSLKNTGSQTAYDTNDGRNAYYIYNKGNITYSGAGHIVSTELDKFIMPDEEVKLFVNTIIAAYRATPTPIDIEILNEDKSTDKSDKDYLLIDYDIGNSENAFGNIINTDDGKQYKRIFFKFVNSTTYGNGDLKIYYYTPGPSDTEIPVQLKTMIKSTETPVDFDAVTYDTEYYIDVPLDNTTMQGKNSYDVLFRCTLTYTADNGADVDLLSKKDVQLLRRGLFNLD